MIRTLRPLVGSSSRWTVMALFMLASAACTTEEEVKDEGEALFEKPFAGTNGRSCATCHVPEDDFTLTPAHVEALLASNPNDPLFNAIDADDPNAETLTFEHLKKGLVRVWLTIPDNVDLIDDAGLVITPADRKIFVWRAVPSIMDSVLTEPYQLDGRVATLEEQAQGAITSHSQGGQVAMEDLALIADFERRTFSSDRARKVAAELAGGVAFDEVTDVESSLDLTAEEERGKEVYEQVCAVCHGGANQATIVDREIHDLAIPELKSDGNVLYVVPATDPPTPVPADQPNNEFLNAGTALEAFLAVLGATEHEHFTVATGFPSYRFRFYADASRTEVIAELPPALPPGDPFSVPLDDDGNPIVGPNFIPQMFTTDPGRAMTTGSPYDFEAFDIPTLRGISKTAPYFHNNGSQTLEQVVELYSDHLLSRFPSLTLPGEKEPDPDGDIGPEEAMTAQQKSDLVAFLKRL